MKMRAVLLFLVAIVPNVSSTNTTAKSFIYIRGNDLKGCTTGKRVTNIEDCKVAQKYLKNEDGRPPIIEENNFEKNLGNAPSGCYYFVSDNRLQFNDAHTDLKKFVEGDEPVCKVPGTGLGLTEKGFVEYAPFL